MAEKKDIDVDQVMEQFAETWSESEKEDQRISNLIDEAIESGRVIERQSEAYRKAAEARIKDLEKVRDSMAAENFLLRDMLRHKDKGITVLSIALAVLTFLFIAATMYLRLFSGA